MTAPAPFWATHAELAGDYTTREEWRAVAGWEGVYEVSSIGCVRNTKTRHVLSPSRNQAGHHRVNLYRVGKPSTVYVHALVLEAFVGPRPPSMEACHCNGNPADNTPENLRWGSSLENKADQRRHGTHRNARKTHCAAGHLYDEANTILKRREDGRVWRVCRICKRDQARRVAA